MPAAPLPSPTASLPAGRRLPLFVTAVSLLWLSLYLYVPILSPYVEEISGSLSVAGYILSAYGLAQMVLRIPVGIWSDRLGARKPFVISGFVAAALAGLGLATAHSPLTLLFCRSMSGVASTMWVPISILFSSYFPKEKTAYAMGLISMVMTISQMMAQLTGGLIASIFNLQVLFLAAATAGGLGLIGSFFLAEKKGTPHVIRLRDIVQTTSDRGFIAICVLGALHQFIMFSTVYGLTPNYATSLGAGDAELGYLTLAYSLPASVAAIGAGTWLVRWWRERSILAVGSLLSALTMFALPFMPSLNALYIMQIASGVCRGAILPLLMGLSIMNVAEEKRAIAMGFFQSAYALGMFVGPAVSGVVGNVAGYTGVYWLSATVSILMAVFSVRWLVVKPASRTTTFKRAV